MYQAGEIKELDAYMQKHDLMGKDTFVKYAEMADLYECLDSAEINTKEHVEQIRRDSGSMSTKELRDAYTEVVEGDIFRCFRVLSITEGWEADGYIYDQQEVAEDFHSRAEEILRDIYQLTEEEIADGTKAYTYDKYYTEIAGEAIERLAG